MSCRRPKDDHHCGIDRVGPREGGERDGFKHELLQHCYLAANRRLQVHPSLSHPCRTSSGGTSHMRIAHANTKSRTSWIHNQNIGPGTHRWYQGRDGGSHPSTSPLSSPESDPDSLSAPSAVSSSPARGGLRPLRALLSRCSRRGMLSCSALPLTRGLAG